MSQYWTLLLIDDAVALQFFLGKVIYIVYFTLCHFSSIFFSVSCTFSHAFTAFGISYSLFCYSFTPSLQNHYKQAVAFTKLKRMMNKWLSTFFIIKLEKLEQFRMIIWLPIIINSNLPTLFVMEHKSASTKKVNNWKITKIQNKFADFGKNI